MKIVLMQEETASKCYKMKPELLPRILVCDPVTHDSWQQGKFTTYVICIETEHPAFHLQMSAVRRRFSELRWLYRVLQDNHPHVHFPKPPGKKIFAERFDSDFINTRMMEIQNYLNELMMTDTVLSDAAFHFFVQTDLTTEEIQEYLNGTLSESIVAEAWGNSGHLHTSSYIVNSVTIHHEPKEIVMNEEDLQQHLSRSLDASNSHAAAQTSGDLDNPAQTSGDLDNPALTSGDLDNPALPTVMESQDLNIPRETSLNAADSDSDVHTVSGHAEPTAYDVSLTSCDNAVIPPKDDLTSCDNAVIPPKDDLTNCDNAVIPPKDDLTSCDNVEEKSAELSDISDVDKVVTETDDDVFKMT